MKGALIAQVTLIRWLDRKKLRMENLRFQKGGTQEDGNKDRDKSGRG
jgi:hypothetical protein